MPIFDPGDNCKIRLPLTGKMVRCCGLAAFLIMMVALHHIKRQWDCPIAFIKGYMVNFQLPQQIRF